MRTQRGVARGHRGGDGDRVRAEIAAHGTSALTQGPVQAHTSVVRNGEIRRTTRNDVATRKPGFDRALGVALHGVHFEGRQEFAIGDLRESVTVSGNARDFFHMRIPWRKIGIADGPVGAVSVGQIRFEIELCPALHHACPEQGFSADLIAADPIERLGLLIGMFPILHEKMLGGFAEGVASAHHGIVAQHLRMEGVAMGEFPKLGVCRRVVFDVLDIAAAFQNQGVQAAFGELFGRPSARHPRADHDRIIPVRIIHKNGLIRGNIVKRESGIGNQLNVRNIMRIFMRMKPIYDEKAPKKATNLSINSDLLRQARALGIGLSAELEARLIELLAERRRREWETEVREQVDAYNASVQQHGAFSDGLRGF